MTFKINELLSSVSGNENIFSNYSTKDWVDIGIACGVILIILVLAFVFFKKKTSLIAFFSVTLIGLAVSFIFKLFYLSIVIAMIILMVGVVAVFFNLGPLHEALTLPFTPKKNNQHSKNDAKAPDSMTIPYVEQDFFKDVTTAVLKLSQTKTGAIMTFQRNMNLDSYMKNGTIIDAPFTPELVETIFYVGTRLHDGAIIVKKNIIVAASVYFTPSTKALTGKFGARHRAALGISEATDSVTVVCSEETGRISIAYNGKMESVRRDEFMIVFKDYMTK